MAPAPEAAPAPAPAAETGKPAKADKPAPPAKADKPAPAPKTPSSGKAGDHATGGTAGTSGEVTQPQPNSGADTNPGGANGQCPGGVYCSTRDGSPSGNGNDVGKATGKPCAGCVGKADNKNPPGQAPDAAGDGNNGYECDTNNGIGVGKDGKSPGNPAHTGCQPTTPPADCVPTQTQDENCVEVPPTECVPTQTQDANCVEVPPTECVPTGNQDENCVPVTPPGQCVPTEGQDENCVPVTPPGTPGSDCVPSATNPCTTPTPTPQPGPGAECEPTESNDFCAEVLGQEGSTPKPAAQGNNRPPVVAGVEQVAPAGVLPATGSSTLTGVLMFGGVALLLAGLGTLVLQRRMSRD